jgi:hypothetical protein
MIKRHPPRILALPIIRHSPRVLAGNLYVDVKTVWIPGQWLPGMTARVVLGGDDMCDLQKRVLG